jgi:hypothetical protein
MILPDFILRRQVNQQWQYTGMDSLEYCLDKNYFNSYPHTVEYKYNSRGFRDQEWPTDIIELKQAVWCVGDSFTVGIGSPVEHTWPYQVSQQLGKRTINISMDGASNEWIARKVLQIQETISPELIIIQWSYTHRREHKNILLSDQDRRIYNCKEEIQQDNDNTVSCIKAVTEKSTSTIIHSFIPYFAHGKDKFQLLSTIKDLSTMSIPEITKLDTARDGHHYDILTAEKFSIDVRDLLANRRG